MGNRPKEWILTKLPNITHTNKKVDGFLWHMNNGGLLNDKSSLYIYIRNIWFGWVWFYDISTIGGYLMPNPLYTYILDIYDSVGLAFMAYQPLEVT